MVSHSSTLAWKIPWMEEPGRLQSMGLLRIEHDWAIHFHFSLSCIGEGNGNPLQCSCLENPRDGGASGAAIYGVPQNRTWLKWLSSSSSIQGYQHLFFYRTAPIISSIQTSLPSIAAIRQILWHLPYQLRVVRCSTLYWPQHPGPLLVQETGLKILLYKFPFDIFSMCQNAFHFDKNLKH